MYIVIVGGGKVGSHLAEKLLEQKHTIVVIEKDEKKAEALAKSLDKILVITGDGCDPLVLEDAGVEKAQISLAVTGDDEDNLIISQLAKESFGVPRVIARIANPKNEATFYKLGIDTISSTSVIAKLIEQEASPRDINTLLTLKRRNVSIVEMVLAEKSPVVDKKVRELKLPEDCLLIAVFRKGNMVFPKGGTILQAGDSVLALTSQGKEETIKKALAGSKPNKNNNAA